MSLGCRVCPFHKECGGYARMGGAWSCLEQCANCDPQTCDVVCFNPKKNQDQFSLDYAEVNGFGLRDIPALDQSDIQTPLPRYIPTLQHGCIGDKTMPPLNLGTIAIPLNRLLYCSPVAGCRVIASDAEELRRKFRLAKDTRVILLGTGPDQPIEDYWQYRTPRNLANALAKLELHCAIAPNYSIILDHPRTQHLANRKRSLICASEWREAGIPPIPYIHALADVDWHQYKNFFIAHPEINIVAAEFQTGHSHPALGSVAIERLAWLQNEIGRELQFVAIAAFKYAPLLRKRIRTVSIIDSRPFMNAVHRHEAVAGTSRPRWRKITNSKTRVSDILISNIMARRESLG